MHYQGDMHVFGYNTIIVTAHGVEEDGEEVRVDIRINGQTSNNI